jgi:hypothetical protein
MADRSLWFESHLFADRAGRRAREAAERLDPHVHEAILQCGDRLAAASPAVAQEFYRHAPAVWEALGADGFRRWFELGDGLLANELSRRDAALAYFSVPAKAVGKVGVAHLAAWCATGLEVATLSRKLGGAFFEGTAPLIDRLDGAALSEWARQGMRLHGLAGWRGEFMAHAYFAGAGAVLPILRADEFASWAAIGAVLYPVLRDSHVFATPPPALAAFKTEERAAFFAAALAIASADTAAGALFFAQLPAAVQRLPAGARHRLLLVFQHAGAVAGESVSALVPVVGALIRDIPGRDRQAALDLAVRVAQRFPRGATAIVRSLPRAYEDAGHPAVEQWVERGLAIAAENPEAGVAYFALESRTSVKVLQASSTAAALSDVQGLLRKYAQMLSGRPVSIRAADALALRPPLEEFPLEDEIALPLKVDAFGTHEENVALYRFLAAQLAGRREFGTYDVALPATATGGLVNLLRTADAPPLLEELFLLVEGFRVATALARAYPGLGREQRELAARIAARPTAEHTPSQSALFDLVFAVLVSGHDVRTLPVAQRSLVRVVAPCVAPLANPEATADDSLAVARLLAEQLSERTELRREAGADGLFLDRFAADALFDQYMDDDAPPATGDAPYTRAARTGEDRPVPPDELQLQINEEDDGTDGGTAPMSPEELQRLIEAGVDLRIKQGYGDDVEGLGMYITDLLGKLPQQQLDELRELLHEARGSDRPPPRRWIESRGAGASFYYDEWDYHISDYRQRWCRLRELPVEGDSGVFFNRTLQDYSRLIPEVRRQFQRIRPEMYRTIRGLEDGEDFDLNAVVNARVDRRARRPPSPKLYVARTREERDVATLFLIDMSASTDEPLQKPAPPATGDDEAFARARRAALRRIIDVTKEALVVMAEALEEIGDAYAIYGFSGHGRDNVEFYLVKSFNEALSVSVKGRIGALEPKRSTRMGTALRHATEKLASVSSRSRHIILLSDGFPQDFDYGQDRRSNLYGLRDTSVALRECESAGITPFCITVDKAGHDYLREMCDESRYMVIDDITALPHELPKIYQRVVTA